jgi:GNAT superfamily N-acetyltransferase
VHISIEPLQRADVPELSRLVEQAGWNQLPSDWMRLIELEPQGCFAVRLQGEIAATLTTICYGTELAWIGMMLVDPRFRRQGIGRRLMEHAIATLQNRSIRSIQLDATPLGKQLYDQLGFRTEFAFHRWHRPAATADSMTSVAANSPSLAVSSLPISDAHRALDRVTFGADRSALLHRLASDSKVLRAEDGSFGMLRRGRIADYVGPVSSTEQSAEPLVRQLVEATKRELFWDIPSQNTAAVHLAICCQFAPVRTLFRMTLGPSPQPRWGTLYALADPALG